MGFKRENIPNILSVLRILMVPAFIFMFFSNIKNNHIYSLAIFIIAAMTDALDGYLARKNGWISDIGKILDPVADKLMHVSAFICLAIKQNSIIWLVVLIVVKELLMVIGGSILLKKRRDLVVSLWYGKMTTIILAFSVACMIIYCNNTTVVTVLSIISGLSVIFSLIMYYIKVFRGQYKKDQNIYEEK
ncbi:CDP-alcohol phosphatidyltransferase family protein [Eubacteriales bacterium OttesenSCG-928-G02]|nr:CDP-alcohol phosphatidyltransferase family protein [Eubacteriales bacterium OttesenSCG-928-G02]